MTQPVVKQSPLSVSRAFVVQFRMGADIERGPITGRVEHVASGQSAHFDSLEELLTFFTQVLAQQRAPPHREKPHRGNL